MLPRPATTFWSSSAAFIGVRLPASEADRLATLNAASSGSGPEPGQQPVRVLLRGRHQVHRAEPARIDETNAPALVGLQHQVLVQGNVVASGRLDQHAARHAQMQQHAVAAVELHQDVLAAPAKAQHARPGQPLRQAGRQRPAQVGRDGPRRARCGGLRAEPAGRASLSRPRGVPAWAAITLYLRPMSDNPRHRPTSASADVPRAAKAGMVRAVFDSVAPRYDLMNDLMSLGVHRVWKRIFAHRAGSAAGATLLDLAGGTGDIGFGWMRLGGGPVLLTDINASMLAVARDRALDRGIVVGRRLLSWRTRNVCRCRIAAFDRVSIAFGLRNCTDKDAVLREARRVLKPGGRFFCLEFSRVQVAALLPVYDAWSFRVLPRLGRLVAQDADSYQYLAESIRTFPDQERLAGMMREAGFARVDVRNLSGGIAAIHSGWRL